jgi:hypothetical protein
MTLSCRSRCQGKRATFSTGSARRLFARSSKLADEATCLAGPCADAFVIDRRRAA